MVSNSSCQVERAVIEVTEDCNHACLHCYNYWRGSRTIGSGGRSLSRPKIREVIRRIKRDAPLKQVAISGGEPMLRPDLSGIVGDLAEEGVSAVVISNGSLFTKSRLRNFPEGTIFEVTLFSADAALHDQIVGSRSFHRILEGLVRVKQHKCEFVLASVVTQLNAHDTARTMKLGIALGADAVMLNRVNLSRRILPIMETLVPSPTALRQSLEAAEEVASKYGVTVAISVPVPPCIIDPRAYPHLHFGWCPRGSNDAYYTVGHTGLLRPCNHSSVILGDLREHGFGELVNGRASREFWSPVPKACIACLHPLKDFCRGGCPAAADECYGSRERVDPFVDFSRSTEELSVV